MIPLSILFPNILKSSEYFLSHFVNLKLSNTTKYIDDLFLSVYDIYDDMIFFTSPVFVTKTFGPVA